MKRALITGHKGFVGRHLTQLLLDEKWTVHGCDIAAISPHDARDMFRNSVDHRYDLVVHCAAVGAHRQAIDYTPLALAANLELDASFFQWAIRQRPRYVVYLSSSAAYPVEYQRFAFNGNRTLYENDIDLDYPQQPDAIYGWIKLTGERLAALAAREGLKVGVVRPFSGYGQDQSTDFPFMAIANRAYMRASPLQIWGSGRQMRDWIHIDDICRAIYTMYENDITDTVNLCSGVGTTMMDLAIRMCKVVGFTPFLQFRDDMPQGVARRVGSPLAMRKFYKPEVTLDEGIDRAMKYLDKEQQCHFRRA